MAIRYTNEVVGSYSRQTNCEAGIYVDGDIAGLVQYVLYDQELTISHIFVRPEYRRQGYGSRLMKYIQKENPDYKYKPSMMTDDGAAFKHKDLPLENKFVSFNNWLSEKQVEEALHTSGTPTDSSPSTYDRSPKGSNYKSQFPIAESEEKEEKEEKEEDPKYGCVMMDANIKNWEDFHLAGIDKDDVYYKPYDQSYGLEENPHVTILYGIHEEEVDPQRMADMIEFYMKPVTVTIEEIGVFEGEEYDVVKYNVPITGQLQKYRDVFIQVPNTQNFPEYQPHMTIAYVKSGEGKKYATKLREPFRVEFTKGVYSWHSSPEKDPEKTSRKVVNLAKKEEEKEKDKDKGVGLPPNIENLPLNNVENGLPPNIQK